MKHTVLITGGGKRLGRLIAIEAARAGHAVIVHYNRSASEADAVASDIIENGGQAVTVGADLGKPEAVDGLVADGCAAMGAPITALINNASVFDYDTPKTFDWQVFETSMRVNLGAPLALARDLVAQLPGGSQGAVVNVLDQKLWNLNPDFYSYTAAKAGLLAATTMMDQQFGDKARANAVAPGILFPSYDQTEDEHEAVAAYNLFEQPIDPADVARTAVALLSLPGLRGQTLHTDNGQRFVKSPRDIMFLTRHDAPS